MTTKYNSGSSGQPPSAQGLFSVRSAVVMLVAVVVGIGVGGLTFLAGQEVAAAILAGLSAAGLTLVGAHALIQSQ